MHKPNKTYKLAELKKSTMTYKIAKAWLQYHDTYYCVIDGLMVAVIK